VVLKGSKGGYLGGGLFCLTGLATSPEEGIRRTGSRLPNFEPWTTGLCLKGRTGLLLAGSIGLEGLRPDWLNNLDGLKLKKLTCRLSWVVSEISLIKGSLTSNLVCLIFWLNLTGS